AASLDLHRWNALLHSVAGQPGLGGSRIAAESGTGAGHRAAAGLVDRAVRRSNAYRADPAGLPHSLGVVRVGQAVEGRYRAGRQHDRHQQHARVARYGSGAGHYRLRGGSRGWRLSTFSVDNSVGNIVANVASAVSAWDCVGLVRISTD